MECHVTHSRRQAQIEPERAWLSAIRTGMRSIGLGGARGLFRGGPAAPAGLVGCFAARMRWIGHTIAFQASALNS